MLLRHGMKGRWSVSNEAREHEERGSIGVLLAGQAGSGVELAVMVFVTREESALRGTMCFSLLYGKTILFHGRALLGLSSGLRSHFIRSYVSRGGTGDCGVCVRIGWLVAVAWEMMSLVLRSDTRAMVWV